MMFKTGEVIDKKYRVDGVCSDTGGMGAILFVTPVHAKYEFQVVLKYCKEDGGEHLSRFRREVRLLLSFNGNTRIVRVVDYNLQHNPPYFVMKYYKDGDLTSLADHLRRNPEEQEKIFIQMIDCVQELHSRDEYHRDIKPQNFLVESGRVVIADLGLSKELGSDTNFTTSAQYWGSHGYIPPEYMRGEFKNPSAAGDIFMLGKTMYALLSGQDPTFLIESEHVPGPVHVIIERCCSVDTRARYQSLGDLKQALAAAYDVLLGRADQLGKVQQSLSAVLDQLMQSKKYNPTEVQEWIEEMRLMEDKRSLNKILMDLEPVIFNVLKQKPVESALPTFLKLYEGMVEAQNYGWSFAETIADNMKVLFEGADVSGANKARALDLAIRAATHMNRFAAMQTCKEMIRSVEDEVLGLEVAEVIKARRPSFVDSLEPSEVKVTPIRRALVLAKRKDE